MAAKAYLDVDGRRYEAWVEDGMVHVRLPFAVDLFRLSALLRQRGCFVAHPPDELERLGYQGWGEEPDPADYYPFWLQPEGEGASRFSFPPVDYAADGLEPVPAPGEGAAGLLRRWLPLLEQARAGAAGGPSGTVPGAPRTP